MLSYTKWATCNVGATKPEDSGLLFQFGRVDGYAYGSYNEFKTKDQNIQDTGSKYIPLTTTGKIYKTNELLDLVDDAAHVHMGGKWRIPTKCQLKELLDNTTYDVVTINGVQGMMFTSYINSKQLFIPFAGCWYNGVFIAVGSRAYMWSSQVHPSNVNIAYRLLCNSSGNAYIDDYLTRSFAFSVRGVFKK